MTSNEILDQLMDVVVRGKIKESKPLAEKAIKAGVDPSVVIFDTLSKAMDEVGRRYETKQYFLPGVLLAAQTLYQALDVVLPLMKATEKAEMPGKVVLAVVEGDVHDIGKNILRAMLAGAGLTVYDMGRDIPVRNIVEKAKAENARVIATSTLMTSTLGTMGDIEGILKDEGLKGRVRTAVGGSATDEEFAAQIGADAWAVDAPKAVRVIGGLMR